MLCACAEDNKTLVNTMNIEEVNIDDESAALYDAFLQGSAKATFDSKGDRGQYITFSDFLNDGEAYTLTEIISKMTGEDQYCSGWICKISTDRYIDCGLDGNIEKEVSLELNGGTDHFSTSMILKNIDGKLKICYDADSWSRCDAGVAYNGEVSSFGSAGACSHGGEYGYIDSLGDYHFWYYEWIESYGARDEDNQINDLDFFINSDTKCIKGADMIYILRYDFLEDRKDENAYYYFYLTDSDYKDIDDNPSNLDNPYNIARGILKKDYGYNVVSQEEIDKMIYEKRLEIGLTDEIYNNV